MQQVVNKLAQMERRLTPEQKKLFNKKLAEVMAVAAKKFEEEIKKYQEDPYVYFNGKKIQKTLRQFIPYTAEEWEKEMEKQKVYKNRQLINFIDKVFFEDGALQLEKHTNKYKHGRHTRTNTSTSG